MCAFLSCPECWLTLDCAKLAVLVRLACMLETCWCIFMTLLYTLVITLAIIAKRYLTGERKDVEFIFQKTKPFQIMISLFKTRTCLKCSLNITQWIRTASSHHGRKQPFLFLTLHLSFTLIFTPFSWQSLTLAGSISAWAGVNLSFHCEAQASASGENLGLNRWRGL